MEEYQFVIENAISKAILEIEVNNKSYIQDYDGEIPASYEIEKVLAKVQSRILPKQQALFSSINKQQILEQVNKNEKRTLLESYDYFLRLCDSFDLSSLDNILRDGIDQYDLYSLKKLLLEIKNLPKLSISKEDGTTRIRGENEEDIREYNMLREDAQNLHHKVTQLEAVLVSCDADLSRYSSIDTDTYQDFSDFNRQLDEAIQEMAFLLEKRLSNSTSESDKAQIQNILQLIYTT